jgi:hypothetical protein
MDLTKGRKSKNILDRRDSNKNAFISNSGNRYANEKDFSESYDKKPKEERVKLGDLYDKAVKALNTPKRKIK